ncbi:MAG TPA: dihydrolipoamide acetyltransferase family protein [Chloroflexota bacterium]|nr:dihydrolipoamide acetyltransferase family protein [Chloroflexota bacterium]
MATAIKMPQLGITMTEAKVVSWLKREGDPVRKGEPIATIETDKINSEVEATADGVLRRIVAPEGALVPVVGLMGVIAAPDEPEAAVEALVQGPGGGTAGAAAVPDAAPAPTPAAGATEVRASPIAKRLAADLGVDLQRVRGSGPGGRIVEADVRASVDTATAVAAAPAPPAPQEVDGFVRASPLARRLAREQGLELRTIRGTGPEGRVVERDVLAAVEERAAVATAPILAPTLPPPAPTPAGLTPRRTIKLEGMRRVIAERMHQSLQLGAQLTLTTEADATALVELRTHLLPAAKVYGHRPPTYTDLLVKLVARTLPAHPLLNSSLRGEGEAREIVEWQEINIGVAVTLEQGLLVPVIRQADQKPLQQISQELAELAERARAGRLSMDDLQGGTFTITNLGQVEIDAFTPIVNPPQCAILGVGRIAKKPAVYQDQVVPRHMVSLSLTFDHRIVDGYPAGAFLRDVKRAIETPSFEE